MDENSLTARICGAAALCLSLACNALMVSLCLRYLAMLRAPAGMLGAYVDSKGGLSELGGLVPQLVLLSVAGAWVCARLGRFQRAASCSAALSVLLWACAVIIAQIIRALLH